MTSIGKGSCRATGREPRDTRSPFRPGLLRRRRVSQRPFLPSPFVRPRHPPHLQTRGGVVHRYSGESVSAAASAGFAREAIGRTSSLPAICNPRGLILRGNDNLGTIRPPSPPALLFLFRFQQRRLSWISVRDLPFEFFSGRSVE